MNATFSKGSGEEQSYPQLDLSGKLIIKAQLGDDVRRIPIHNEAITYDELVLMMQRVFRGKLSSSDDITIKYKDEDGDLITIFDSSDLAFAVQYSRILKLQILVGGEDKANQRNQSLQPVQVNHIRRELQHIRDQVNHLLDSIEPRAVEVTSSTAENRNGVPERNSAASKLSSREFDPLQEQAWLKKNHSAETIGTGNITEEAQPEAAVSETGRGSTPDSIGSSSSRQVTSGFESGGQQQQQSSGFQPPPLSQPLPQQQQQLPTSQGYQPPEQPPPQSVQPYQQQGFPGYQVQPMFMGGQVMSQQNPGMLVHGQQSLGQPSFSSPYQTYPPVQPGYPGPQKGGTSTAGYRPSNPSQPTQPQSYPQDYNPQQSVFAPPRFTTAPQPQPPTTGNPYSKGASYSRPPSQPGYQ
ncbi:protein TFG-like [Zootermopsis nevadensis]|uniref:Protein TFG n=1 Tax=Zootermopsis nevadensis TaxID=136037 RepID=A0A067QP99_ZOONE|nr:protein TFG-like [Zootermopsis nevadensis]XP_021934857.1 protein TFG-like [Zootermopsis nevadensis]XP_021934858.1 protein TFG-like [Zootermopsis nevadensis]XP_021934859.1 protein TFG-like [Zootermopsis nevadensis]KDR11227.1 Protein TFG [Zootermopsis nevadensis]